LTGATNVVKPAIARKCWILPADVMQCDDVLVVRAHEARHRGVNHSFASELAQDKPIELQMAAPPSWARRRDELMRLTSSAWSTVRLCGLAHPRQLRVVGSSA